MANADLKTFLEDRLRALEPTIDLDAGSPAQVQFIEPVLTYLGTDPFETDIDSFITDRFRQEYPNVFSDDPGVVRDVFIKPLMTILDPFKREIQSVQRNQSLRDPALLSDDDADALVANVFDERNPGGFAVGTGRLFYTNPTNAQIEITNRIFTTDGLGFFPTNPISMTAEEMVFNKTGSQYFLDVPLKAESQGSEYNIDVGQLSGIDGQFGVIKVSNLQKFVDGASTIDTPTFVASAREALNERSLVTRRGATARLNDVFQTELRAVQVIGAKDPEMERDILVATSPGHSWIEGKVQLYGAIAMVSASIIDGEETDAPVVGDTLFVYLSKSDFPTVPQASRFVRLLVEEVLIGPLAANAPYQMLYLVRFSGSFPSGVTITQGSELDGGFSKKGTVQISSLPTIGAVDLSVPSGDIHVFGHTDFYIRPILQPVSTVVFDTLFDADSLVERLTLQTLGLTEANKVADPGSPAMDFVATGVVPGDLLSIETGDDIGVYVITKVTTSNLYVSTNLTNSQSGVRYRIIPNISVNPFEPKVLKFPFGSLLANDLQTTIGSTLFTLSTNDVIGFGAQVGDTLRVSTGIAAGDYLITGFDSVLGGKGPIVDRAAPGTSSDAVYEVFSALEPVQKPLVRIKELLLLDSSKQTTGITVPCADPVGAVPTGNFTSARVRASSQRLSGFILPSFATTALTTYLSGSNVASSPGDRYSLGLDIPVGLYKAVTSPDTTQSELDYHANPSTGVGDALDPASYFVSTAEYTDETENFPPADPKPGDALFIKNGPNRGNYLIKSVYKFKHKLTSPARTVWTYFIKIYGEFPVDVFGQLFDFLNDAGGGATVSELPVTGLVAFPSFFTNLYDSLGTKLNAALTLFGATSAPSAPTLQAAVDLMTLTEYDWGDPARGTMRTFFTSPTLFQQNTGANELPTMFSYLSSSGDVVKFRPDPFRYTQQELVPARLTSDADPLDYPRDMDQAITLVYGTMTSGFAVGATLTGATSGATATIIADANGGATGTLTLGDVVGIFVAAEIVTDDDGTPGSATVTSLGATVTVTFTDPDRSSMFNIGVEPGDVLAVHEEVFFHGTDNSRQTAIQTLAGSTQVTAPTTSGNIFTADMVGNLFYVEEGTDLGAYRVTKYVDGKNLLLDKAMTVSTPTILAQGPVATWGHDGTANCVVSTGFNFTPYIGKYITIYGMEYSFQGSYAIATAPVLGKARITKSPDFPGTPSLHAESAAHFVITNAPPVAPTATSGGTELYGLRPVRMYESAVKEAVIATVVFDDISLSRITLAATPVIRRGLDQPFRIYRTNLRRITPSEMALNVFGPLVYFDTEVVSLSPQTSANIAQTSYLTIDEGTFTSSGYRHRVADRTLTYSMLEDGFLDISPRILPLDSADSQDNFINLLGSPIQVTYEQSDLVRRVQEFADSAQDRVTSANLLARHFLPSYVSYIATYIGGSAPSIIASDIISYINSIPVETPLDVSEVQALLTDRGGNPTTPTAVQVILHDWSRRMWLEFSENQLGGTTTLVPYDGTPRVTFFIPGPDVSGQDPVPSGEQINLDQQ